MTYFDDAFRDIDAFYRKITERMSREMEEIDKAIQSGRLQGEWDVRPIEKPGVRGYVAHGRFQLGEPLKVPKQELNETREPLTDVFEEEEHVKFYVELPGVEKGDIQLNITDAQAEIKAKMPVAEMIGLASELRSATQGRGTFSMVDQSFEKMPGSVQEVVVKQIRERKGLAENE